MPDNSVLVLNFQKQKRESLKIRNCNSVYREVENERQKLLSDRSVLTEKNKGKKLTYMARLFEPGFE